MHAIDRARERYGVDLTRADLDELQRRISDGEGVILARLNDEEQVSVIAIDFKGVAMRAVWSGLFRRIKTFQPLSSCRNIRKGGKPRKDKKRHRWSGERRPK